MLANADSVTKTEGKIAKKWLLSLLNLRPSFGLEINWIFPELFSIVICDNFESNLHTFFHRYFPKVMLFDDGSDR